MNPARRVGDTDFEHSVPLASIKTQTECECPAEVKMADAGSRHRSRDGSDWPRPLSKLAFGAAEEAGSRTLEISAEGDRIVPLNASTHEQYLDKTIEKLSQVVSEIQLLRKDVEAIRRLVNEIAEKRTGK